MKTRLGLTSLVALLIAAAAFGFGWMSVLFGAEKAFALGVAPFWLATILKTLLAAALVAASWKAVARLRG